MIQRLKEPVSVVLNFDHRLRRVAPEQIVWQNRTYIIKRLGLHHSFRQGRTLFHIFSVETETLFFRLSLNTDNLHWIVEEVSDGEPE